MSYKDAVTEFIRLYGEAGGKPTTDPVAAVRELFAAYSQARVFAAEISETFAAERARAQELEQALEELQRTHAEVERSEHRFRALVSNASDVVIVIDPDDQVTYASDAVQQVCGCSASQLTGGSIVDRVHPDDAMKLKLAMQTVREEPGSTLTVSFRIVNDDRPPRYIEAALTDLSDEPTVGGIVLNARDVSERVQLEDELRHAAYRDPLTGLPNRALVTDYIENAWPAEPGRGATVGLLLVDIDHFKLINDTRGHPAGDEVLVEVARSLREFAPNGSIVGRLGGDEFAMLVRTSDAAEPLRIANELVQMFGEAAELPSISVGLALPGKGCETPAELVRAADLALYQAKQDGRGRCATFDADRDDSWVDRLELEADLEAATRRGQLRLLYQPIVDLATSELVAAEALVRWDHSTRGTVSPAIFIPLAEESDVIIEVGSWVLRTAVRQLADWDGAFGAAGTPSLGYLSVNVSAAELRDPGYAARVGQLLDEFGVASNRLQLELTETILAEDGHDVVKRLEELKALGVRLAIDDFGTGYSSLSYLTRMPVDLMKVDRSFVDGMLTSERVESVVRATMSLAEALGLKVVAEGVETVEQHEKLRALGGLMGQGYLYARPLAPDELVAMLVASGSTANQTAA